MPGITSRIRPGRAHRDRGAAAVEFALVMAPLIMLLLGLTTAGLAYNDSISMTNAVREGARFGATTSRDLSSWGSTVQTRTAELSFGNLTSAQVCVTLTKVGDTTPVAESTRTVTGSAPADPSGAEAGTCLVKVWAQGNGAVQMCHTAVMLADDDGTCAVPSSNGRAPYDNSCAGYVDIRGTGGLDWSAPDMKDADVVPADFEKLEDLALWTETSGNAAANVINRVEGGGLLAMSGVFFLPNAAPFRIAGQGGQDIGENAQFVSRRLEVAGNGHLNMRPDPDDVVTVPYWGDSLLVR